MADSHFYDVPGSIWRTNVTAAPIDTANSAAYVQNVVDRMTANYNGSWFVSRWGGSNPKVYRVTNATPTVPVYLNEPEGTYVTPIDNDPNDGTIYPGHALYGSSQLAYNFRQGVPVLDSFVSSNPADWHMIIHNTDTNQLWEFWHMWLDDIEGAIPAPGGPYHRWIPRWGAYINDITTHSGFPGTEDFPYMHPGSDWQHREWWNWGSTATSLHITGGLILEEELYDGVIPHALQMSMPYGTGYVWPASRYDNFSDIIPQGTRFRLKSSFNPEAITFGSVQGTRTAKMVSRAAQQFGIIVNDHTPGIQMRLEWPQSDFVYYDMGGVGGTNQGMGAIWDAAIPVDQLEVVDPAWRPPNYPPAWDFGDGEPPPPPPVGAGWRVGSI